MKIKLVTITSIIVISSLLLVGCGGDNKEASRSSSNEPDSIFQRSSQPESNRNKGKDTTTTTGPRAAQFTPQLQKELYNESVTGEIDTYAPHTYTSPRWEMILGGDASSGIPLSELDKASNSDLDPADFSALRGKAIGITTAQITGTGVQNYPDYFTPGVYVDKCKDLEILAAGAISIPYSGDGSWAKAVVYWEVQCPRYNAVQTSARTQGNKTYYFHRVNGSWVSVLASALPTS